MLADDDRGSLGSKSDAELAALEHDRSLSPGAWAAVEAERARRASGGPTGAVDGAAPPVGNGSGDRRLDEALRQLRAVLVPGETIDAHAVQRRLFALTHRRLIVAATSGRFISFSRGLLGGYTLGDVRWQDLRDASLHAGVFGADLTITSLTTEDLATAEGEGRRATFVGLRKDQAASVYRLCQAREQAWREKRRVRDLDELRARSGGIQLGGAASRAAAPAAGAGDETSVERLRRAKEMLDGGLITDAEYESIKARVIDGM